MARTGPELRAEGPCGVCDDAHSVQLRAETQMERPSDSNLTSNVRGLFDLLEGRQAHLITGHTHFNHNVVFSDSLMEHNTAAVRNMVESRHLLRRYAARFRILRSGRHRREVDSQKHRLPCRLPDARLPRRQRQGTPRRNHR